MGNNCSIDIGLKEGARKPPPVQTLHILQCLPFLPTRSPYQDLENKKKWENRSRKLWVRALLHCMTPGDIINLIVMRMVPSGLEQCTICPAGHGAPGETRVLARWVFLFLICAQKRGGRDQHQSPRKITPRAVISYFKTYSNLRSPYLLLQVILYLSKS